MSVFSVLMMFVGLVCAGAVLLFFIGAVSLENDEAKANRYLADLHDRDAG